MRLLLLITTLISATAASAASIGFTGVTPGNTFNYTLTVSNEKLASGNYFVIYDFLDAQTATGPNANWSSQIVNNAPNLANDTTISDIIFSYSGADIVSDNGSPADLILIGGFTVTSLTSSTVPGNYYAHFTHKTNPNPAISTDLTTVAGVPSSDPDPVPEPATMSLMGISLAVVATLARRRAASKTINL